DDIHELSGRSPHRPVFRVQVRSPAGSTLLPARIRFCAGERSHTGSSPLGEAETAMGIVIGLIIGTLAGAAGVFAYLRQTSAHRVDSLESKARVALAEAERDAETSRREALVEAK